MAVPLKITLLVIVFAASTGCSGIFGGDSDPKSSFQELSDMRRMGIGTHEEFMKREEAKRLYASELFVGAITAFDSLRDTYPMSSFSEFYTVKSADAAFELGRYQEAATQYQELFDSKPLSAMRPYYALRAGRSHLLSYGGIGRDIKPINDALRYLSQAQTLSRSSELTKRASQLESEAQKLLEAYERQIIAFYQDYGNEVAAGARESKLRKAYSSTSQPLSLTKINCLSEPQPTLVLQLNRSILDSELSQDSTTSVLSLGPLQSLLDIHALKMADSCPFVVEASNSTGAADKSIITVSLSSSTSELPSDSKLSSKSSVFERLRFLNLTAPARLFVFTGASELPQNTKIARRTAVADEPPERLGE